jgi:hypothetical protein
MKKVVLRFSFYSLIVMVGLFVITMAIGKSISFQIQEIAGFVGIILAQLFVYFGIRQYRDQVNNGNLSFGKGLQVGLLIVLIPALLFGLVDVLYSTVINPGFYDEYCGSMLVKMKATMPAAAYEKQAAIMRDQMTAFKNNPFLQFVAMFFTVFPIGMIITVISSLALRRNKPVRA